MKILYLSFGLLLLLSSVGFANQRTCATIKDATDAEKLPNFPTQEAANITYGSEDCEKQTPKAHLTQFDLKIPSEGFQTVYQVRCCVKNVN